MNKVRIRIIGIGKHGSHYVRKYLETDICKDVELTAIADNNSVRLGWAKEHLKNVAFFDDAIKMLDTCAHTMTAQQQVTIIPSNNEN